LTTCYTLVRTDGHAPSRLRRRHTLPLETERAISIFHYYRQLIRLRKANPIIVYGSYDLILDAHEQIYAFTRTLADERLLVMLNFTQDTPVFVLPTHIPVDDTELVISNYRVDPAENIHLLTLRPFEARVYRLR